MATDPDTSFQARLVGNNDSRDRKMVKSISYQKDGKALRDSELEPVFENSEEGTFMSSNQKMQKRKTITDEDKKQLDQEPWKAQENKFGRW